MFQLRFSNPLAGSAVLGPFRALRVGGNFMRNTDSLQVVADYHHHCWHIEGHAYSRYDCPDPVWIRFENAQGAQTPAVGPLARHFAADGTMYADEKLFARFHDETQLWQFYESETYWPIMIIESTG